MIRWRLAVDGQFAQLADPAVIPVIRLGEAGLFRQSHLEEKVAAPGTAAVVSDFTKRPGTDEVGAGLDRQNPPPGVAVAVDLDLLIQEVRVSPEAPSWFADAIRGATERYGLAFPVVQSALAVDPVY